MKNNTWKCIYILIEIIAWNLQHNHAVSIIKNCCQRSTPAQVQANISRFQKNFLTSSPPVGSAVNLHKIILPQQQREMVITSTNHVHFFIRKCRTRHSLWCNTFPLHFRAHKHRMCKDWYGHNPWTNHLDDIPLEKSQNQENVAKFKERFSFLQNDASKEIQLAHKTKDINEVLVTSLK